MGVSSQNSYPGIDPNHDGFDGYRTDQVLANLPNWLTDAPDVVTMHLGTNDFLQNVSVATAANNLDALIDTITGGAPGRRLFVATILPIKQSFGGFSEAYLNNKVNEYNVEVRNLVQQYANLGRKVFLVEMNGDIVLTNPNSSLNFFQPGDGIHPGQAGYNQMGDIWFDAINAHGGPFDPAPAGTPNPPTSLTAMAISGSEVVLTWADNSLDETGFEIYQYGGTSGWQPVAAPVANATTFNISGLNTGANMYYFAIRADNASGHSAWSNVVASRPQNLAAYKPSGASSSASSNLAPAKANDETVGTLWASSNGDNSAMWMVDLVGNFRLDTVQLVTRQDRNNQKERRNFELQASADPSFANYAVLDTQGSTALTHASTKVVTVTNPTPFRYVRLKKLDSDPLSMAEVRVYGSIPAPIPAAPGTPSFAAVGTTEIGLTWADNSPAETGFKLERKTGAGGTFAEIAMTPANATAFTDTGLTAGTQYFYRLRATNGLEDSGYSPAAGVTTETGTIANYDSWAAGFPEFMALPSNQREPGADANGDGIANLLAYAMVFDPLAPVPPDLLPRIVIVTNEEVTTPFFQYRRRNAADLTHDLLTSDDLSPGSWGIFNQQGATVEPIVGEPDSELVTVPLGTDLLKLARLRVTLE